MRNVFNDQHSTVTLYCNLVPRAFPSSSTWKSRIIHSILQSCLVVLISTIVSLKSGVTRGQWPQAHNVFQTPPYSYFICTINHSGVVSIDLFLMHYSSHEMSHEALFWVPSFSCCTLMIFHVVYQKACNVDICADDTTLWKTSIDPTSIQHGLQSSLIKADHSWSLVLPPKQDYAKCKENKIVTSWNEAKDFSLCKSGPESFIIFFARNQN